MGGRDQPLEENKRRRRRGGGKEETIADSAPTMKKKRYTVIVVIKHRKKERGGKRQLHSNACTIDDFLRLCLSSWNVVVSEGKTTVQSNSLAAKKSNVPPVNSLRTPYPLFSGCIFFLRLAQKNICRIVTSSYFLLFLEWGGQTALLVAGALFLSSSPTRATKVDFLRRLLLPKGSSRKERRRSLSRRDLLSLILQKKDRGEGGSETGRKGVPTQGG